MFEVRISRTVSEGPFDFEITRVNCTRIFVFKCKFMAKAMAGKGYNYRER